MHSIRAFLGLVLLLTSVTAGNAEAPVAPSIRLLDQSVIDDLKAILGAPVVWKSVIAQNERHKAIAQRDIDRLDNQWIAERNSNDQPLIASVTSGPLSSYLLRVQAGSLGLFSEIFIMDGHGLNVGQSSITSDYWQGDEAKFQKTFPVSATAVFIDEPEHHEESGTWRAQINMSIADPESGGAIGAATFEINLTELERRRALRAGA